MSTIVGEIVPKKKRSKRTERAQQIVLESLDNNGGHITKACAAAGITRQAYQKWMKNDPEFAEKASEIIQGKVDNVEWALYAEAVKGNVTAQIFYLKNKRPDEWQDVNRIDARVGVVDIRATKQDIATVIEKYGLLGRP